jgi:DNA-binding NtrC family response regulator
MLVDHFITNICAEYTLPKKAIEAEAIAALARMRWSGNIRELRNVVERLIILSGERITVSDIELYV